MIAIVDDEELEKRKAYRIPQNTRINTWWTVRVNRIWSEWAVEGNDLIQLELDSETILQVSSQTLNITDKDEPNCWLSKFNSSSKFKLVSKHQNWIQFNALELLWESITFNFFVFGLVGSVEGIICINLSYGVIYTERGSSPPRTFSLLNIQEGCTSNKGCWITKERCESWNKTSYCFAVWSLHIVGKYRGFV